MVLPYFLQMHKVSTTQDPMTLFCDQHILGAMKFSASVPVAEIENFICTANWNMAGNNFLVMYDSTAMMDMWNQVRVSQQHLNVSLFIYRH